jgi:Zn-dependent alcohol dehydrogenase
MAVDLVAGRLELAAELGATAVIDAGADDALTAGGRGLTVAATDAGIDYGNDDGSRGERSSAEAERHHR